MQQIELITFKRILEAAHGVLDLALDLVDFVFVFQLASSTASPIFSSASISLLISFAEPAIPSFCARFISLIFFFDLTDKFVNPRVTACSILLTP